MRRPVPAGRSSRSRRPNAFSTDIRRTITGNLKRFISLFIITALGATMLVGLKAACDDLRATADSYYDAQHLFDISIKSTLGLDKGDIEALSELDDVDEVEGGYTETAYTEVDGTNEKVDVKALLDKGLNAPLVLEGRLPEKASEVAVTRQYLDKTGKHVGDTVTFEGIDEDDGAADADEEDADKGNVSDDDASSDLDLSTSSAIFKRGTYTITASVLDPMDVNNGESLSFRNTSGSQYAFFLTTDAVENRDVFTVAYLTVKGADALPTYSDEYQERIDEVKEKAEAIRAEREDTRTESVKSDALETIEEKQTDADKEFADAERKLSDAQAEIDENAVTIADGRHELSLQEALANEEIAAGRKQLDDGYAQLKAAERELEVNAAKVADGLAQVVSGKQQLASAEKQAEDQFAAAEQQLAANEQQLAAGKQQAEAGAAQAAESLGEAWPAAEWAAVSSAQDDAGAQAAVEAFAARVQTALEAQLQANPQYGQLTDGLNQAKAGLDALEAKLSELQPQLDAAQAAMQQLDEQIAALDKNAEDYDQQLAQLQQQKAALQARVDQLQPALTELQEQREQAQATVSQLQDQLDQIQQKVDQQLADLTALAQGRAQVAVGEVQLAAGKRELAVKREQTQALLSQQRAQIAASEQQLAAAQSQIESGRQQIDTNRVRLDAGLSTLNAQSADAQRQIADALAQLEDGEAQLAEGQAELDRNLADYQDQKADAQAKLDDARSEVDDMDPATWYIQDRTSLPSYSSVESDASSIESIATVFPLIFFTVAVLISLTTVTRMVEEDRGLIGVYKALGYSKGRILSKYLIYAFAACLTGGIAGDALGFIVLPEIIFTIFRTMYALPEYQLCFNAFSAFWGIALFAVGIVGATFLACRHVLRETPASLMRPKAPRAGKRILLERITPLWRRMGFLNKVSARNLFRYKKRFFMTVFGIAGCTALMICGLGIRDTVVSLKGRQYGSEGVVKYDLMAVAQDADFDKGRRELEDSGKVSKMLEARVDTVTAEYDGTKESVQIVVVPDGADLAAYLRTADGSNTSPLFPANADGADLSLPDSGDGVLITKNAEQVLGFGLGDELALQDSTLRTGTVRVDGVTINYLGNFVFMTQSAYREAFGEPCTFNAFLVNLEGTDSEKIAYADELAAGDTFVSVSSSTKIANDFSKNFKIIDVVVYVVTVMAAALAFAVVFTLSNTNISERERELATIKVLGFRKREVHVYINKETIILTLIGIVAGFPLGYAITRFLTYVLRMPSLFFDTIVEWPTYVFAAVMSLVFTLIINQMTNRSLDKIDMVGALKSAE